MNPDHSTSNTRGFTRFDLRLSPIPMLLVSLAVPCLSAAPTITSIANAASNIGFNAPIAQGAVFVIKGSGLGPANLSTAPTPFQSTTLSGTSVAVTVGTTTVAALLYYTSDAQVAALLPSNTPTGAATFTVSYNGQPSNAVPHGVAISNLGILTLDSTGQGPAIVTYASDYSLVSATKTANCGGPGTACGAANPGDALILWGTGLGPVTGSDASGAGLGQNMPNVPLTLWLGGVQAQVIYQGRSGCCIGLDQVAFVVPAAVPTGCAVPLVVQIGTTTNTISNTTALPVANGGRTCTSGTPGVTATQLASLGSSFNVGVIELDHLLNDSGSGYNDQARFNFIRASGIPSGFQPFLATFLDNQPAGTCTVFGSQTPTDAFFSSLTLAPLDDGSAFTITGPKGTMMVMANTGDHPELSSAGTFLTAGDYSITGGPGKDAGSFTAHLTIPASPTLTSPVSANNLNIPRAQGMTVTWNSNGSSGHVELVVASSGGPNANAQAVCTAPAGAGTFTIPPYVLLALPAGNATNFYFRLGDMEPASAAAFSATGLDAGIVQSFIDGTTFSGFTLR